MSYTADQINELLHDPDVSNKKLCEALYNVHEDYLVAEEDIAKLKEIMISDGIGKVDGDDFFWWNEAEWVLFN